MEVKVKTEVLFKLLKKALSENRTYNNPAGNFVHLNDLNPGPIEPTPQMAVQLSADAPPVEDPDFIPASMQELKAAAARIQDTDFALETAALTKASVLNQSAMAMVAQANQAQQAILTVIQ